MARLDRLPEDYRYHISRLEKPCHRPMLYSYQGKIGAESIGMTWIGPPTSLTAFRGTCGHAILSGMHEGFIPWGASAEFYAQEWSRLFLADMDSMLDSSVGRDVDGSGRRQWIDKEPQDLHDHVAEYAEDMGAIIANYCAWWRAWMGTDDPSFGVVGTELRFRMALQSRGGSTRHLFEGMIDLVVRRQGKLYVLDWKFGAKEKSDISQASLNLDPQLHQYCLAVWKADEIAKADGELVELEVIPDKTGIIMMEDLRPYAKATNVSDPGYTTDARREWVEMMRATSPCGPRSGKPQYQPGDWRGPVLHDTTYTQHQLEEHANDMCLLCAGIRMGTGLARRRGDHCTYCFFRDDCLEEWYGTPKN